MYFGTSLFAGRKQKARAAEIRTAVVELFGPEPEKVLDVLGGVTEKEWERCYLWLDASGMALYLIDTLKKQQMAGILPFAVWQRLEQNLVDNRFRTADLLHEMQSINRDFIDNEITFSNMKGISLPPESVPDASLRFQLDLDFLVAASDIPRAIPVLESYGYKLHQINGLAWEFKTLVAGVPSIDDMYKPKPHRSIELHFLPPAEDGRQPAFPRVQWRRIGSMEMPVFPAAGIFIGQAKHFYEHLHGEFTRIAWLLEFKRHIEAHEDDFEFWFEVRRAAFEDREARIALGVTCVFAQKIFGCKLPEALRTWTVDSLPHAHMLWVEEYGRQALMADFPGGKHFLFLAEVEALFVRSGEQSKRKRVLPLHLPIRIQMKMPKEDVRDRLKRYRTQLRFVVFRLRFHLIEGARCGMELQRWQQRLKQFSN